MKNKPRKINISKIIPFAVFGFFVFLYFPITTLAKEIDTQEVFSLINASRLEKNLSPLILSEGLSKVAQSKANDMTSKHYFSHTSPEGKTPWHWFNVNNYSYKYAGENLAINYDNAEEEHKAWMNSATHKKNILSLNFTEIGIATATGIIDGKKSKITVTVFGTPEKNILASSANTFSSNKKSYILGVQTNKKHTPLKNKNSATLKNIDNNFFTLAKNQSHNIIWTIALVTILIVSRDIVLKTIQTKSFHHKHSIINLILFIMIYITLF